MYLVPVLQEASGVRTVWRRVVGVARGRRLRRHVRVVLSAAAPVAAARVGCADGLAGPRPRAVGGTVRRRCRDGGHAGAGMLVFVAVQSVFVLPRRAGLVGAAACVLVAVALAQLPGWSPMADVAFSVALASIAMWGVTGMLQRNVELAQAQATIAELAVQNERTRFARDLHDILGHSLTVLTVKAELAGRLVQSTRNVPSTRSARSRRWPAGPRRCPQRRRRVPRGLPARGAGSARAALEAAGIAADLPARRRGRPARTSRASRLGGPRGRHERGPAQRRAARAGCG